MKNNKTYSILLIVLSLLVSIVLFAYPIYQQRAQKILIGVAPWGDNEEYDRAIEGFKVGLELQGYHEDENVEFIFGNADSDAKKQVSIIQNFVKQKVDLIFTLTTPGTLAAKKVTRKIPIVFGVVTYPKKAGVVKSFSRSGNNLVGVRNYLSPAMQLYLFDKVVPDVKSLLFVHRKGEPNSDLQFKEFKSILSDRDIELRELAATDLTDINTQLERHKDVDVIYMACDTLIQVGGDDVVIDFSSKHKIPNFSCNKGGVLNGALMGYISDFYSIGQSAGRKAGMILNGAEPTWLQTQAPKKGYLMLNMKAAKTLGITFPESVLADADIVVRD